MHSAGVWRTRRGRRDRRDRGRGDCSNINAAYLLLSTTLVAEIIASSATSEQRRAWLPAIADGFVCRRWRSPSRPRIGRRRARPAGNAPRGRELGAQRREDVDLPGGPSRHRDGFCPHRRRRGPWHQRVRRRPHRRRCGRGAAVRCRRPRGRPLLDLFPGQGDCCRPDGRGRRSRLYSRSCRASNTPARSSV